jgi:hypothetical protein
MTTINTFGVADMSMSIDNTRYDRFAGDIVDDGTIRDVYLGPRAHGRNPSIVDKQYTVADWFSTASIDKVCTGKSNKPGLGLIRACATPYEQRQKKKNGNTWFHSMNVASFIFFR